VVDIQNVTYEKSYTYSEEEKDVTIAKKYDTSRHVFVYKVVKLKMLSLFVCRNTVVRKFCNISISAPKV